MSVNYEAAANMVAHFAHGKDTVSEVEERFRSYCISDAKAIVNAALEGNLWYEANLPDSSYAAVNRWFATMVRNDVLVQVYPPKEES